MMEYPPYLEDNDDVLTVGIFKNWYLIKTDKEHQFIESSSIFSILAEKENPLLVSAMNMISDTDAFECKLKKINLNHKVIGSFYNAKFEMMVYNKEPYRMSHSSANYRKTINGIGRMYKFYNSSDKLINIFEGEIQNA